MSAQINIDYSNLLGKVSGRQWREIGTQRRAGVATPLFSVYSKNSVGIGDFADIKLLVDWCKSTKNSILQLLPLNCMGNNNAPYSAQSSFALDASYISLENVQAVPIEEFKEKISLLRQLFPIVTNSDGSSRVDFDIKREKLKILKDMFFKANLNDKRFLDFKEKTAKYWLDDYVLYRSLKEVNQEKPWTDWESKYKNRESNALGEFKNVYKNRLEFHKWVQWQLFEQLKSAKDYATSKGVNIMGDMPFLTSKDSADVWSHQNYFNLDKEAGAPPDMYCEKGQRWGMPTHKWGVIKGDNNFEFIRQKRQYAQNFYHMDRNDHVFGMFRIWTINSNEPRETEGLNGFFDPQGKFKTNEEKWVSQGRELLTLMIESSSMLHTAEDLGSPPDCCTPILEDLGIPGIDVDRWSKNIRAIASATTGTHDSSFLATWLEREATPEQIREIIESGSTLEQISDSTSSPELIKAGLFKSAKSSAIFYVPPIHDLMSLDGSGLEIARNHRINTPGVVSHKNWNLRVGRSLDEMLSMEVNQDIIDINSESSRV